MFINRLSSFIEKNSIKLIKLNGAFEKPLILVNVEENQSLKSIDDVYLQLVENEVAKLVSIEDLVQTLDSVKKGESWKISESSKRKEFLKEFFNHGQSVDLLNLVFK